MEYEVKLDVFEGPLDLLLYLIKKNEIDIYDIPIALIVEQYLAYIEMMKSLNLDVAGDYLVMASTLIHIKSKMLLPAEESVAGDEKEEEDPRTQLVTQLLEYKKYKEAAEHLEKRPLLDKDVFTCGAMAMEKSLAHEDVYMELNVFDLVDAFYRLMKSTDDTSAVLEIDAEKISLADTMNVIMDTLQERRTVTFMELLGDCPQKKVILMTFLALLELMKSGVVKVYQAVTFGEIYVSLV